ncbi:protein CLT1, chloroplastic [Senna tora]|uniref:Protein CLT1, chloroplastic n=1 Tax=Senna tora TaxID=362788 RepID=A0A834W9S7_9FABA|nr:protein CLT1, chloroplastic [Senna tora]
MAAFSGRIAASAPAATSGRVHLRHPKKMADGICGVHFSNAPQRSGVVLRSSRIWLVEAVGPGGAWERSGLGESEKVGPCSYAVGDKQQVGGFAADGGRSDGVGIGAVVNDRRRVNRTVEVAVAAVVTVVFGVGNRVLYKLALVPLKHYPFFLAQLATFGYVIVYFSILYIRYHAGVVTDEMLSMPKAPFLAVGLLEALGAATGMAAGAILSGASIPILSQTFLVWQIMLSIIFLGRRYKVNQLLGCFLVAIGVIITVASGSGAGHSLKEAGLFWNILMIISFLLQAADTVLKEVIFLDANKKLKGGSVDLFVVNSYGSAFQVVVSQKFLGGYEMSLLYRLDVMVPHCYPCCLLLSTWVSISHCSIYSRSLQLLYPVLPPPFQFQYPSMSSLCHCHTSALPPLFQQAFSQVSSFSFWAYSYMRGPHPMVPRRLPYRLPYRLSDASYQFE